MRQSRLLIGSTLAVLLLSACNKQDTSPVDAPAADVGKPEVVAAPAAPPAAAPVEAAAPQPDAGFSVDKVPLSTAALPPFPFFDMPEGLVAKLKADKATTEFARHYFLAGKTLVAVEGQLYHNEMSLIGPDKGREYSATEFHRNYSNAVQALGGAEISETQFTRPIVDAAGGLREINPYWHSAPPTSGYEHHSYLIRTADKEYWIHVGTATGRPTGYVVVLEKAAMAQSLGFLDAGAMKSALDADGHVPLHINFDTDKATLRPDSRAIVDEIRKLLDVNAGLKLSIEGHTDNTGSADHNRQLSAARARSVLGALVGLGIDPSRLSSEGFGPDKPVADNADEAGRAKNRRVELVKR